MAKPSQTFKKRQRENKLREKAQLKRERRQQRQIERKTSQAIGSEDSSARPEQNQVASTASDDAGIEQNG
jgi:hypothetical protein